MKHRLPESDNRNLTVPDRARTEFPSANRGCQIANNYTATYLASESLRDTTCDRTTISIDSKSIQKLPNNHKTLLASFTPNEQVRVIKLLKLSGDNNIIIVDNNFY